MPTLGSIAERIRSNKADDAKLAAEIEARLDAIERMKAEAMPILQAELEMQEHSIQSLHNDALVVKKAAEEVSTMNGGPTLSPTPSSDSAAQAPAPILDGTEVSQVKWTGR